MYISNYEILEPWYAPEALRKGNGFGGCYAVNSLFRLIVSDDLWITRRLFESTKGEGSGQANNIYIDMGNIPPKLLKECLLVFLYQELIKIKCG